MTLKLKLAALGHLTTTYQLLQKVERPTPAQKELITRILFSINLLHTLPAWGE